MDDKLVLPPTRIASLAVILWLALTGAYFTTAPVSSWSSDTLTNTLTAWTLGNHGSLFLTDHEQLLEGDAYLAVAWVKRGTGGPISQYPPGAALLAAPLYGLTRDPLTIVTTTLSKGSTVTFGVPSLRPAALAAAATTAAAMSVVAIGLSRLGSMAHALGGALVFAFGTAAWSVSSQALWMHGPAMLWVAIAILPVAGVGLSWALAIVTRPHTFVMGALSAAFTTITDRSLRIPTWSALGMLVGVIALVLFNRYTYGIWSAFGGYADNESLQWFAGGAGAWLVRVVRVFADTKRGLFVTSPFLLVLAFGLRSAWQRAPRWAQAAAIGGLVYLIVPPTVLVDAGGGDRFIGYRLPLEGLVAMAPLLFLAFETWVTESRLRLIAFWLATAISVLVQAIGVANPFQF